MNAVLFKAADTVAVTNFDLDIQYGDITFKADRSLTEVDGPIGGGDFPRYSFAITCREGSPQHDLFSPGSGPEPAAITLVDAVFAGDGTLSWEGTWEFVGVLGEGSMLEGSYKGIIQHEFEYRLHALPRVYWNARYFKANDPNDAGGDHVATLGRDLLSSWRGINMEPEK